MKKDYSISFVRFVSMCMIIICHCVQRDGLFFMLNGVKILYSDWLNVAVQCFLFISGYLYGQRRKLDVLLFYKKGFTKILVDYYVYLLPLLLVIFISPKWNIDEPLAIQKLLTFSGHTQGFGHLWFIKNISLCYLITPLLILLVNQISKRKRPIIHYAVLGIAIHIIISYQFTGFKPACILCYFFGILYSRVSLNKRSILHCSIFIISIILVIFQYYLEYNKFTSDEYKGLYGIISGYAHDFVAISLVVILRIIYSKFRKDEKRNHILLDWSDKFSYDVYLTHFVFFWSPFDFFHNQFSSKLISIVVALIATLIATYLVYYLSKVIRKKVFHLT